MGSGNHLIHPIIGMPGQMDHHWGRRDFVKGAAALVGAAGLSGYDMRSAAAELRPEVAKIRLTNTPAICLAPQYIAEELLKAEGFTEIQYVKADSTSQALASGEVDISMTPLWSFVSSADAGAPLVMLAGVHLGCYELFGTERVRSVRDLKGKSVPVFPIGGPEHLFLSSMAAYVGIDPHREINWITKPASESMQLLAEAKVDAFLGFPPEPQELRAKKIGHVVVDTAKDRPWSQYYCCVAVGSRNFVQKNPVATKRALRAILKAADICARNPERAARLVVERGFTAHLDYALQALTDVPYNAWRTYDPENTLRFYALRLYEVGMIKSTPQKIIAQGTDWRFLNELKRELKA